MLASYPVSGFRFTSTGGRAIGLLRRRRYGLGRAASTGFSAGLWAVAPGLSSAELRSPKMAISDTARRILTDAAQHPHRLASPPEKLPAAACRALLNSLLKQGYVEECAAPDDLTGPRWQQQDGTRLMVHITQARMAAVGAMTASADPAGSAMLTYTEETGTDIKRENMAQESASAPLAAPALDPVTEATQATPTAAPTRPKLRDAARRVLARLGRRSWRARWSRRGHLRSSRNPGDDRTGS